MAARRRIPVDEGRAALRAWAGVAESTPADRTTLATAVRYTLEELAERAPGRSVEVRVPPFAATQCVAGPVHTRGTPPAVVETDPQTWLRVATGASSWAQEVGAGLIRVSGRRTDLSAHLPLTGETAARP